MRVKVILHGLLKQYNNNIPEVELELEEGTTPEDLIHRFKIPPKEVSIVAINGSRVDKSTPIKDGDTVKIFQVVGGG